jgi:hypothetical protein
MNVFTAKTGEYYADNICRYFFKGLPGSHAKGHLIDEGPSGKF